MMLSKTNLKNITIAVNEKLIPFFKNIYKNVEIIDYRLISNYDNYEYHLPMGSMGLYFQTILIFTIIEILIICHTKI